MTLDIKDRLYTSSEVAEILGVSLRSVYRYLEEGKLDADIKTATGRHRFSKKNILDFLQPSEAVAKNVNTESKARDTFERSNDEFSQNFNSKVEENKFSPTDTIEDEFDFDSFFETDLVKKKEDFPTVTNTTGNSNSESSKDSLLNDDEDLEKLFEELEKEFAIPNNSSNSDSDKKVSKLADDDFDFDFDFLDSNESLNDYLKTDNVKNSSTFEEPLSKKEIVKKDDDDFDFDFLDSFFEEEESKDKKIENKDFNEKNSMLGKKLDSEVKKESLEDQEGGFLNLDSIFSDLFEDSADKQPSKFNDKDHARKEVTINNDESSESWLEKFRKASEKVNENVAKPKKESNDDFDISNFFNSRNSTNSIIQEKSQNDSFNEDLNNDFKSSRETKKKDYYYISSLSGPKEIAQTIDKVARKFDLDYAFTLNAGLSLHKDISPFTLINVYINERDLEIFEDYLKLTPSSERDAHVCLMMARDREVFEDSYELNGLFVVSNVQLRSDFIDKGMDNYAREV